MNFSFFVLTTLGVLTQVNGLFNILNLIKSITHIDRGGVWAIKVFETLPVKYVRSKVHPLLLNDYQNQSNQFVPGNEIVSDALWQQWSEECIAETGGNPNEVIDNDLFEFGVCFLKTHRGISKEDVKEHLFLRPFFLDDLIVRVERCADMTSPFVKVSLVNCLRHSITMFLK